MFWQTDNAKKVNIDLIGDVGLSGTKTINLHNETKKFKIILSASNAFGIVNKIVEISILNKEEAQVARQSGNLPVKRTTNPFEFIIKTLFVLLLAYALFFLFNHLYNNYSSPNFLTNQSKNGNTVRAEKDLLPYLTTIKNYYHTFRDYGTVQNEIQEFYHHTLINFHGMKDINSQLARQSDLKDFTKNKVQSYQIKIDTTNWKCQDGIAYYLFNLNLQYLLKKEGGITQKKSVPVSIALLKDSYKIIAVSKKVEQGRH